MDKRRIERIIISYGIEPLNLMLSVKNFTGLTKFFDSKI